MNGFRVISRRNPAKKPSQTRVARRLVCKLGVGGLWRTQVCRSRSPQILAMPVCQQSRCPANDTPSVNLCGTQNRLPTHAEGTPGEGQPQTIRGDGPAAPCPFATSFAGSLWINVLLDRRWTTPKFRARKNEFGGATIGTRNSRTQPYKERSTRSSTPGDRPGPLQKSQSAPTRIGGGGDEEIERGNMSSLAGLCLTSGPSCTAWGF